MGGHFKGTGWITELENNSFREADLNRTEIRGKVLAVV
jgi:hypothetical protein